MNNSENQKLVREILGQAMFETDSGLRRTCLKVKCGLVLLLVAMLCLAAYVYKAEHDVQMRLERGDNTLERR